jgi:hypothetical protein
MHLTRIHPNLVHARTCVMMRGETPCCTFVI